MNDDLTTRIIERFSIEEIADAVGITPYMFVQAFADEIVDNFGALSDIDHGFTTKIEDYE
jgi:hypothetical protein